VPTRARWSVLDALILGVLAALLAWVCWRVNSVFHYRWDWSTVWPFLVRIDPATGQWAPNLLLQGLATTVRLTLWGMLLAVLIGTVMGWARAQPRLLWRLISGSYVMTIRNIPPVVFVFIFVFFISSHFMPWLRLTERARELPESAQWVLEILFGWV